MGKNLICEICHLSFARVRALRRHCCPRKEISRLLDHSVARPTLNDESWQDEPLCSLESPPAATISPAAESQSVASLPAESPPTTMAAQPPPADQQPTKGQDTAAVQSLPAGPPPAATPPRRSATPVLPWTPEGALPPPRPVLPTSSDSATPHFGLGSPPYYHTIPQLLADMAQPGNQITVQLTLTYHVQDPAGIALSGTELRYSQMMGPHQQRHLCDCARCVSHALRLRDAACHMGPPRRPGIRFNRVPGVTVAVAARRDMHALIRMVADRPDCALIACGCRLCSLHRNLLRAWLQVVAADGPASS